MSFDPLFVPSSTITTNLNNNSISMHTCYVNLPIRNNLVTCYWNEKSAHAPSAPPTEILVDFLYVGTVVSFCVCIWSGGERSTHISPRVCNAVSLKRVLTGAGKKKCTADPVMERATRVFQRKFFRLLPCHEPGTFVDILDMELV